MIIIVFTASLFLGFDRTFFDWVMPFWRRKIPMFHLFSLFFFAEDEQIEMKFSIKVYHNNIKVKFDCWHDRDIFDSYIPWTWRNANYLQFLRRLYSLTWKLVFMLFLIIWRSSLFLSTIKNFLTQSCALNLDKFLFFYRFISFSSQRMHIWNKIEYTC